MKMSPVATDNSFVHVMEIIYIDCVLLSFASEQWRRQVSEFGGGAFEGQHAFWGGGKNFTKSPLTLVAKIFYSLDFFSIHFFRNFFPDISNFFPDL